MRVLRALVGLTLIGACFWLLDAREILAQLAGVEPVWLTAAVAALLAQTVLMALRWRLVARCLGTEMTVTLAIREYLAGQLLNSTLPGGVLGDAARAVRARTDTSGIKGATQAVVIERVAGQIGLAALAAIGLAGAVAVPGGFTPPPALTAAMAAGLIALAGLLVAVTWGGTGARLLRQCLPSRETLVVQAALSLGAALLNVAAFAACARATGTALSPGAALVLIPLILGAMLIPLTVGGWGWREGAAAALFPLAGATSVAGVTAGIAFGGAILLSVLPVAAFALSGRPSGRARPIVQAATSKGAE